MRGVYSQNPAASPPLLIHVQYTQKGGKRQAALSKLFKYRSAGVREYWIVDPDKNRILVYNFASEDTGDYTFSETVKAGIYEDLEIDFSSIEI